jgi:uncharacterized phiE125 gp8 family phage protein
MGLIQTVAPLVEPVSLTEAKLHLRVDVDTDDTLISALIASARQDCEAFQNRAYINRTMELWLDRFPGEDHIDLPLPPLVSVTSIAYYDTANSATTVLAAAFSTTYFVDSKNEPGKLCLGYGATWPTTTLRPNNGVCITYVCGYGTASESVPVPIRQAILLSIGAAYENREGQEGMPSAAESLLWKSRSF